jgi:hypothetical protein
VGGVIYALAGLVGMERGGGVDLGRDTWRGPNDGMGLVLVFGAMVGKGLIAVVAASFNIVYRTSGIARHSTPSPSMGTSLAPSGLSLSAEASLA